MIVHIIDGDKVLVVDDRVMPPCPCGHPLSQCWGPDCGGPPVPLFAGLRATLESLSA
jgi:hypothetical protein